MKVIVQTEAISRLVHANKEFSSKFSPPPPPPQPLLISLIYQVSQPCYILSFSRCCILRGNLVHYFPNLARAPQKSPFTFKILAPHFVDSHWFSLDPYSDAHDICQILSQVQFLLNILNIIKIDLLIQSTQGRRNC